MREYLKTAEEVLQDQKTSASGLDSGEAAKRLEANGKNKLTEAAKTPLWKKFLEQMSDPMIIILIVAAAVSGVTALYSGESFADVIIIMLVVIINAVLGLVQENKADSCVVSIPIAQLYIDANEGCGLSIVEDFEFTVDKKLSGVRVGIPSGENELAEKINELIDEVVSSGQYEKWHEEYTEYAKQLGL